MKKNSIKIELRKQSADITLFAGCGGLNVSEIIKKKHNRAVSEYKRLTKQYHPLLWKAMKDDLMAMEEVLIPKWQNWDLHKYYPNEVKRINTEINLNEQPGVGKIEIARRIIAYFRSHNIPVGRSFTGDPEIWIPSQLASPYNGVYFEKFIIRTRYKEQSEGWEFHVTHTGTALVSKQPKAYLPELPEQGYRVMVDNEVVSVGNLYPNQKKLQHAMYPVANRKIERIIRLKPYYKKNKDKLVEKRRLIDGFLHDYLLQDTFKEAVGIDYPSGEWMCVDEKQIWMIPADARLLEYADSNTGLTPVYDIPKYGPYQLPEKPVKFIMIFQNDSGQAQYRAAMKLLNGLTYGVNTDKDIRSNATDSEEQYREKMQLQSHTSYKSMSQFIGQPFSIPEGRAFKFDTLESAVEDIRTALNKFKADPAFTYEAIYISPIKKDYAGKEAEMVYFKLKEMLMERGIMMQTIYNENPYNNNFQYFIPNLSVAMFAKTGGIPYVLHKPYGENDLIIGVGAYCNKQVGQRYVGSAICFNNRGVLQGYNCWPDCDTDRLKNTIKEAIISFIRNNQTIPGRVIIHYYKTMSRREARPITTMLYNLGLKNVALYVVNINKTESEDLVGFDDEEPNLMPISGTTLNLGSGNYLLYNNTRYQSKGEAEVLFPIKVRIAKVDEKGKSLPFSDEEALELLTQVYQFSRLSYKSVKQQNMPITTLYPELAARIVPFFDGKSIPENGRQFLGFL